MRTARRGASVLALGLLSWVAAACQPDVRAPARPTDGTTRMRDSLAAITARVVASPQDNAFINRERTAMLRGVLATTQGTDAYGVRNALAEELLRAGNTREAIAELEALVRDAHLSWDAIEPQKKSVFDLLAVAYLRLGEQENCQENPSANVCILPLAGGARHTRQEGARGAIERYTKLLQQYPDDRGSQWLLNIAYLQIGTYPDSVPAKWRVAALAPRGGGSNFPTYANVANAVGLGVQSRAGGVNVADFNGDGLVDVFTTSWGLTDPVHLFLADGKGGYVDHSREAGLQGIVGGLNTTHADYDNDGDEDVLIMRGAWLRESGLYPFSLLRNKGNGTFEDVTIDAGLYSLGPTNTVSWVDFNLDGHLDLFVGYESYSKVNGGPSHPSKLFASQGNGTFTEVAAKVGIPLDDFVKGSTWGDINHDGLPDLFVSVLYGRNKLYVNRGGTSLATWRFEEQAAMAGVELPLTAFPTWFFDVDNDGWDDLFVPSYDVNDQMHEMVAREFLKLPLVVGTEQAARAFESSKLYRNRGDGTFQDVTASLGLDGKALYAMGSNFGDLDNDGFLDVYLGTGNPDLRTVIPNRMFRNVQGTRFEEVTLPGGFGHLQKGHAVAFADFDRDGDEDIFEIIGGAYQGDLSNAVLFENPGWAANQWLALSLEGRTANRSAIGARVEVVVRDAKGTRSLWRTVSTGGSFGAGPLELHIGLGRATVVQAVHVQWPDAAHSKTSYPALALKTTYKIVQGEAPVVLARPAVPFRTLPPGVAAPMMHNMEPHAIKAP